MHKMKRKKDRKKKYKLNVKILKLIVLLHVFFSPKMYYEEEDIWLTLICFASCWKPQIEKPEKKHMCIR